MSPVFISASIAVRMALRRGPLGVRRRVWVCALGLLVGVRLRRNQHLHQSRQSLGDAGAHSFVLQVCVHTRRFAAILRDALAAGGSLRVDPRVVDEPHSPLCLLTGVRLSRCFAIPTSAGVRVGSYCPREKSIEHERKNALDDADSSYRLTSARLVRTTRFSFL
ncbi:hypothetical protein PR001_g6124 [Phytophthora rubi]|uniref:Uncharacterized protein n=1 Tax=Phytophthora rubi TaxID=129364 RepID=A0A6A3NGA8_9STRA|nr:hypothetical protein PR001_g6124 [Phytophthora rubi]